MDSEKIYRRIARLQIYYNLGGKFIAMFNSLILIYLFVKTNSMGFLENLLILIIAGVILLTIVLFYFRHVLEYEQDEYNKLDKVKMETLRRVKK